MQSAVVGRYSKDGVGVIGTGFAECFWSLPRRPGGVGSENTTAEAPARVGRPDMQFAENQRFINEYC